MLATVIPVIHGNNLVPNDGIYEGARVTGIYQVTGLKVGKIYSLGLGNSFALSSGVALDADTQSYSVPSGDILVTDSLFVALSPTMYLFCGESYINEPVTSTIVAVNKPSKGEKENN